MLIARTVFVDHTSLTRVVRRSVALLALVHAALPRCSAQAPSPGPRNGAVMAFDAARRHTLLFGGWRMNGPQREYLNDLWAWDGSSWRAVIAPPGSPVPPRRDAAHMAFDAARNRVVLFGGRSESAESSDSLLRAVWEWDGTRWFEIAAPGSPRVLHAMMTFDPADRRVVMFGGGQLGEGGQFAGLSRKLWAWDGVRWALRDSAGPADSHPGAFGARLDGTLVLLLSGGSGSPPPASKVWTWSRGTWTARGDGPPFNNLQPSAAAPDGTVFFQQSWDNWLQAPVMNVLSPMGDWRRDEPTPNPGLRSTIAVAWDSARSRLVLFGGIRSDRTLLGDTWEFDGRSWVQR